MPDATFERDQNFCKGRVGAVKTVIIVIKKEKRKERSQFPNHNRCKSTALSVSKKKIEENLMHPLK